MSEAEPDVVAKVHEKATSLEKQSEALSEFREFLAECDVRIQNMDATERSAFYEKGKSIRTKVDEAETVDQLLALEEEVEEAIRAPLEQVAVQSLEQFLEVLDPDLTDSTREDALEKLAGQLPQDLETAAEVYQSLIPRVNVLPLLPKELIAADIEKSPSQLLNPKSGVEPVVDAVERRYETLTKLDTIFNEAANWVPSLDFPTTERFYKDKESSVSPDRIEDQIGEIQATVDQLEDAGIAAEDIVEATAIENLADVNLTEIYPTLKDIDKELTSIQATYADVTSVIEALDEFGTDSGIFEEEIDDLIAQHSQLEFQSYSSLKELSTATAELQDEISDFIEDVQQRLKAQQKMIDVLDEEEVEDSPELHLGTGGAGPILPVHVEENPLQALKDCKTHHQWIMERLETDKESVDQKALLDLWERLSEGETVKLSAENKDAVFALSERLSLSVVLSGE